MKNSLENNPSGTLPTMEKIVKVLDQIMKNLNGPAERFMLMREESDNIRRKIRNGLLKEDDEKVIEFKNNILKKI
jgi:uncharacterized protein YukE